jgi:hypothetical protein
MTDNSEQEKMYMVVLVASFKVLFQHLPGKTEVTVKHHSKYVGSNNTVFWAAVSMKDIAWDFVSHASLETTKQRQSTISL